MRIVIVIFMALFALTGAVSADDSSSRPVWRERAILAAGRTIQGDYVAAGRIVRISGTVNGDVYAAGWRILVDGTINGDLIAAGAKIIVSGTVAQNVRIAAAHAVVSGDVGRSATVGAADIQVTESGQIHGNMLGAGGDVEIEGPVGKNATIAAGKVMFSNHVGGDLHLAAGAIRLAAPAMVEGKFRYWGDATPAIEEGATIRGAVTHRAFPEGWQTGNVRRVLAGWFVITAVISFVSTLILGLFMLRLYPQFTRRVASMIHERPLRSLGWGTAAVIGIPLAAVILLATVLGLPIGIMLLALYLIMLYLARIYVMTYIGEVLLRRTSAAAPLGWSFVTGLTVYALLSLIPVVGEFVTVMTVLFGLGALLAAKKDLVAALRKDHIV